MSVRPLRPTDVVALASFERGAGDTEVTAHTWPKVEPESGRVPYVRLASMSLTRPMGDQRAWVACEGAGIDGFLVARTRAGGLAWDVEHLHVRDGAEHLAVELIERAASHAAAHGARRLFLDTPAGGRGQDIARRAAFNRFAGDTLYCLNAGTRVERADVFEARPRLRSDEQALFQLYLAAVPASARAAEAMTLEEWTGLHRGPRAWKPSVVGTRQHFVWELGTTLVGWMAISFGNRSQLVELLVHPRYDETSDRLLRFAALQASPKAALFLPVRDYQSALASAAQRLAFRPVAQHDLFVRMLAARVPERRMAAAGIAST